MNHFPRWKIILISLCCFCGIVLAMPNFLSSKLSEKLPEYFPKNTINLGLDLKGGSHLLLEVDFDSYLLEQVDNLKTNLRQEMRSQKIGYLNLNSNKNNVTFFIREKEKENLVEKFLRKNKDINYLFEDGKYIVSFNENYIKAAKKNLVDQSIEIVRRRVDEHGTREPIIQKQGEDKILLQVPGLDNPEHLKNLIGKTAKMTFHLVNETVYSADHIPHDTILLESDNQYSQQKVAIYKKIMLNGDLLKNAMVSFDNHNRPVVAFEFNSLGAKIFADLTKKNIGKRLAIVLDNKLICAPSISVPIVGGAGHITGNYSAQSANDLALLLRAGALPAPLKIVEERTVGPSLGAESIYQGKIASIIAVLAVMVFMILTYGILGIFANIALCFNMIFLVAILSMLQATLTLPGIAGIVLTMGMSVDANVLIFERIYEENKNGLSTFSSLERGFSQAFNTIIDSNLTTILVGIFLYSFGSGAVKGFAVTLILGIITSMFSAITLTRLMMSKWVDSFRPKSFI